MPGKTTPKIWFSVVVTFIVFVSIAFTQFATINTRDNRSHAAGTTSATVSWPDPILFRNQICLHDTSTCQPFKNTSATSYTWTVASRVSYDLHVDVTINNGGTWYGWENNNGNGNGLEKDCGGPSTCSMTFSWAQVDFIVHTTIDNTNHAVKRPTTSYTYSSAPANFSYSGNVVFHYLDNLSPAAVSIANLAGTTGACTSGCPVTPPTVNLKANNSDGPTVAYNSAVTLSWTVTNNPTSCTASNGWSGAKSTAGSSEFVGNLVASRTYTISCSNAGGSNSDSVTVTVSPAPAPSVNIKANTSDGPITIGYNTAATITWSVSNASSCTASNAWSGAKNTTNGSESTGNLTSPKTYTLTCSGAGGSKNDSVIVNVGAAPPTGGGGGSTGGGGSVPIKKTTTTKPAPISKDAVAGSTTPIASTAGDIVVSSGVNKFLIGAKEVSVQVDGTTVSKKLIITKDNEYFKISASNLTAGKTYTLKLTGDWLLPQSQDFVLSSSGTNLALTGLKIGDLNSDSKIADADVVEFLSGFINDKFYDLNADGAVNAFDYSILIGNIT